MATSNNIKESAAFILSADGPLASKLEGYEERPGQVEMASLVQEAFEKRETLMVEAGTGTGKSLAYLIPAAQRAVAAGERIVIATRTINLQEQLTGKDIPLLHEILDIPFKAVLVKGRSNYLCRRKALEAAREPALFDNTTGLEAILKWAEESVVGSLSELDFIPDSGLFSRVASEYDTCLKSKCQHYDNCFYYKARAEVSGADILITNHSLLFSDLAIKAMKGDFEEGAALPPFKRVVIDEAHGIEAAATDHFGTQVSKAAVSRQLARLSSPTDRRKGLLSFLHSRIKKLDPDIGGLGGLNGLSDALMQLEGTLYEDTVKAHALSNEFFENLFHFFASRSDTNSHSFRLTLDKEIKDLPAWPDCATEGATLCAALKSLAVRLRATLSAIRRETEGKLADNLLASPLIETGAVAARLSAIADAMEEILFKEGRNAVRWVALENPPPPRRMRITLKLSPLDVGELLFENLYERVSSVVLTSATLSVRNKFDFMENRLGVDRIAKELRLSKKLPSPFDYEKQVKLIIHDDLPEPGERSFAREAGRRLSGYVKDTGGGALVLFTSYSLLNGLYDSCSTPIASLGIRLLRQGTAPRATLLEDFTKDENSVLLGTDSFWEGVDVPGPSLRSVVITRLPFEVPDDPVTKARLRAIEEAGGSAFRHYTLPNAVIKFRQGFGRLIRKKSDTGTVLVLDKRIRTKSYGKIFLDSLPGCDIIA